MITKPMLAGKAPADLSALSFPLFASPKLDGIRCLIIDGKAVSRTFKPIPNTFIRTWLEAHALPNMDGELMLRNSKALFREVSSAVMSEDGRPDFVFNVFDWVVTGLDEPFASRFQRLQLQWKRTNGFNQRALVVPHALVDSVERFNEVHAWNLEQGFEGTMVRTLDGPYKCGRSTTREAFLLKVKNWADEEATVIGFEEQMHNANEAGLDELGHTKRSTTKEGKVPGGRLGALKLRFDDGTVFHCGGGPGFTQRDREEIWARKDGYLGRRAKIKHQPDPGGRQPGQPPRIPQFIGWRDGRD